MGDLLYWCLSAVLQNTIWGGELLDEENLPERGPAVLVCNHLGSLGPIAAVAGIPLRMHPWVAADMLDPRRAAEYLRWDFIEKELKLGPPISGRLAGALAKITVPLLRGGGCVPVYTAADKTPRTFDLSLEILHGGGLLLVFPEDPAGPRDSRTALRPFMKGFIRLAELYFGESGRALRFHPLAVHAETRCIRAGRPVRYNPHTAPAGERRRIRSLLESEIRDMLLELAGNPYAGIPLPR